MGVYAVKPRFRASLRGLEARAIAARVSADSVTTIGTICACSAALVLLLGAPGHLLLMAVTPLVLMRLACNALDGMIAADTGTARPLGQVYNEVSDRLGDSLILLAVTMRSGALALGAVTLALVLISSYIGMVAAAAGGSRQYGGVMGKADRMLLLALAAPLAAFFGGWPVLPVYLAVLAVGSLTTIVQRAHAIRLELTGLSSL